MGSPGIFIFIYALWVIMALTVFVVGLIILLDLSWLLKLKVKQNQLKLNAMIKDSKP